jgi:DNA ligase-1
MKNFKPMLAPNKELNIKDVKFPLLVSYKLDGIRCIFKDGQMYTRALKQFPNVQLRNRFKNVADWTKSTNVLLDGELLSKSLTFNELSGITRQLDKALPDDLYFYCFDAVKNENYDEKFQNRLKELNIMGIEYLHHVKELKQVLVDTSIGITILYEQALDWGCDGLILRDPNGRYKFGRGTTKEGLIYKMKPFQTFDARIVDVIQATEVREGAEKKTNELGRSVTSKKKDDRILIKKAAAFLVIYIEKKLKVTIAMTDKEKKKVWENKEWYIGRWIEYKGMLVGSKDLPRHPVFIRFRDDKN